MAPPSPSRSLLGLAGWFLLTFAAGAAGAAASVQAAAFYGQLVQPAWAPPAWLFGPVWTVLYLLMALAAWRVWRARGFRRAAPALALFLAQLVLNALWSWLFFAWHLGRAASLEILGLEALLLGTVLAFGRIQRLAAILLLPYLAWVTFSSALCLAIVRLNPGRFR